MKITVDRLIHQLEVFLRENPSWDRAQVMVVANCLILKKGIEVRTVDLEEKITDLSKNSS